MIPFTPHLAYECLELLNVNQQIIGQKSIKNIFEEVKLQFKLMEKQEI